MNRERYEVLGECLTMVEAIQRTFSRNQAMDEARAGYEAAWDEQRKKAQVLREMMIEERMRE